MRAAALWTGWLRAAGNEQLGLLATLLAGVFVKGHLFPRIYHQRSLGRRRISLIMTACCTPDVLLNSAPIRDAGVSALGVTTELGGARPR